MGGSTVQLLPLAIVFGLFLIFIVAGQRTRKRQVSDYGFAGGYTNRVGIGAAIASNWMSAASFLGLAGVFYLKGYYAMAFVVGWTGGYVLLLVLMASQIRRFGKYTAPDFVGFRYGSEAARTLAALIAIAISVVYSVAQFRGIGLLVSWLFGIGYRPAVIIGASLVVSYVIVSGILGVARNQKLHYFVLITTFIVPLMLLTRKLHYFWILPQFGYGAGITDLQQQFGFAWPRAFSDTGPFAWFALCFTLMFGTAGLPHVLSRFYMVPGIRDARWGVVWGLFFIALIYWSAPAYAVLARMFEAGRGLPFAPVGPVSADAVVISATVNGGLPLWVTGLLVAGGMSAAFSTVAGLMLTGAASFSYDIYPRLMKQGASENEKIYAAKGCFLVLAVAGMVLALQPTDLLIAETAAVAFALAGNTIFPAFLLGIWWERANSAGVVAGMLTGLVITALPFVAGDAMPLVTRLLPATSSAFLGAPLVMAVMVAVSLATPPPPPEIRSFLKQQVHG